MKARLLRRMAQAHEALPSIVPAAAEAGGDRGAIAGADSALLLEVTARSGDTYA